MKRQLAVIALAGVGSLMASAQGATITYLGADTSTGGGWRTATLAKPAALDVQGDNVYGTDGYVVRNANTASAGVVQSLTPGYVASIAWTSSLATYGINSHAHIDDPMVPGSSMIAACWYQNTTNTTPFAFATITLNETASFVLGVIDNTFPAVAAQPWNNSGIQVIQTAGGSVDSGVIAVSRIELGTAPFAHYTFFQVDGVAGDAFSVRCLNIKTDGTGSWPTMAGLTFDTAPVPEPTALAVVGLAALGLGRRRR